MDLLEQASAWLETQRTKYTTRQVVYRRGEVWVEVPASIGKTTFELDDGSGAMIRSESRDYLILAAELVLAGTQTLPDRGDRIIEAAGGQEFVYEVMAPGDEPHWRYSDLYRKTLRIHTRQVEGEEGREEPL